LRSDPFEFRTDTDIDKWNVKPTLNLTGSLESTPEGPAQLRPASLPSYFILQQGYARCLGLR